MPAFASWSSSRAANIAASPIVSPTTSSVSSAIARASSCLPERSGPAGKPGATRSRNSEPHHELHSLGSRDHAAQEIQLQHDQRPARENCHPDRDRNLGLLCPGELVGEL